MVVTLPSSSNLPPSSLAGYSSDTRLTTFLKIFDGEKQGLRSNPETHVGAWECLNGEGPQGAENDKCHDVLPECVGLYCGVTRKQYAKEHIVPHVMKLPGITPRRLDANSVTPDYFMKEILGHTPTIFTGGIEDWVERITVDNLAKHLSNMEYPVHTNVGENWILSDPKRNPTPASPFQTFLDRAFTSGECADRNPPHNCTFYGIRMSLYNISELSHNLKLPHFLSKLHWMRERSGVWAAQKHLRVPPHVDGYSHRFMAHVSGVKRVVLLPPGYLEDKNTDLHPIVAKGFLLHPGEILYIPPCWTHQIYYVNFAVTGIIRMTVAPDQW